jgi:glycosyltransferase involved in cell wall biosynthesis
MAASGNTISVVIPLYNRREEVGRALASVQCQSRAPDEILVVDDASSDGSADVVAASGESRINLLRHECNQGASAARNTGIAAARGDWIALLDSDDEWDERKLESQLDALARAPDDAAASVTGYLIHDYRTQEERAFVPRPADAALDALVWGCPLGIGSTLVARRSIFAELGAFDPDLPRLEDWEWLMRYLPAHRLEVLPQALTIVHKKGDPSRAQVAAAVARIRTLHRGDWYRYSWLAGRKFDSTLLVEEASAAHYEGDDRRAVALALRALGAYPFRPGLLALLARRALRRR